MSSEETDTSSLRQSMMDYLDEVLKEREIPPQLRQSTLQEFEQAMQDAKSHPKPVAEVMTDWQESAGLLRAQLKTMEESGDISATESADLSRQFDKITDTLETMRRPSDSPIVEAAEDGESRTTTLPQGMPKEVAAALKQRS